MSMMQRALVVSHDILGYNTFHGIVVNRYPMNRTTNQPAACANNGTDGCWKFSDLVEGDPDKLVVKHTTVIG
jgi:hypothetical protein